MDEETNIYRMCRLRARESLGKDGKARFGSSEKAAYTLQAALDAGEGREGSDECHVSYASVKDYESGKTVPTPETVELMADVYRTPELKWLHCARSCPLGRKISPADPKIGSEDVYHTYFDLAGAFDLVDGVEDRLHRIIEDEELGEDEDQAMDEILETLDRITESAKELRVWVERQRSAKGR